MEDVIYRQDAIRVLNAKCKKAFNLTCGEEDCACPEYIALRDMPSAQPEIIRCRNCKFASGDSRICMKFGHSPIGELDFCAWAERRTDEE